MSLTKHPAGSLRELWSIAFPLMISSLSVLTMMFIDRYMLAQYSTVAHNAAVNATTFGWSFIYGWMVLGGITEVFVAQYNGAKEHKKIGEPVWQMIWLSIASIIFFLPMALWGSQLMYDNVLPESAIAQNYFKWMMYFGPSYPCYGALCGFFVGRGKTASITVLAVAANFLNAGLDYILIFGIEGWIPSYGPTGAAIATSGSAVFQTIVLLGLFLSRKNRESFGTGIYVFKPAALGQCIKIGLPGAVFVGVEILGFASYYAMMTSVGELYITVAGICQNVVILLYFFSEGVSKAATTVAGNLIGSRQSVLIPKVFIAGCKMHLAFVLAMIVLFYVFAQDLSRGFLPYFSEERLAVILPTLTFGLFCMIVHMFFEGIRLLLAGLLTAAGRTFFLLYAGSLSVWVFFVLPVYLVIVRGHGPIEAASVLCIFYSVAASLLYFWRFRREPWVDISLVATPSEWIATDEPSLIDSKGT